MSQDTELQDPPLEKALSITETGALRVLDPATTAFSRHGARLRLTLEGDRSYPAVTVHRTFPLSHPRRYYSVRDSAANEVGLLPDPGKLGEESRRLVEEELRRRYMISVVTRVTGAKDRFGTVEWHVLTDRGPCNFTTRELRETVLCDRPGHYIITDVEGNRFEIPDLAKLDRRSQELLMRQM
jgi:hypothetical protein